MLMIIMTVRQVGFLIRMLMIDIMTVIQVGFLIRMLMLSHQYMKVNDWIFDTNVNVSYKCWKEGILMLRMDTIDTGWVWLFGAPDCLSHLDTNVKDGYECYEFDIGWVWLFISSGYKC